MSTASQPSRPRPTLEALGYLLRNLRLTWRLLLDRRVPWWLKAIPVAVLLYVLSPLDLIPDVLPVLGQMDDLTLILLGLSAFLSLSPAGVVQEHRQQHKGTPAPGGETIEAAYRVLDEDV